MSEAALATISGQFTSEDLCEAIAATFNAIGSPIIAFQARVPTEVPIIDASYDDATVLVYPLEETEEVITRGDALAVRMTPNVLVFCPLSNVTRKTFLAWCKQLRRSLNTTEFGDEDNDGQMFRYEGSDQTSLYDADSLKTANMIAASFRPTYYGIE